jgi:hypothetical protein
MLDFQQRIFAAERMCAWQVSDRVGNVRNNDMALLDPASPLQLQNQLPLDLKSLD